jgi:circadian clock protein KaiC
VSATRREGRIHYLSETAGELRQSAKSHGWSLKALSIIDLTKMNSELGLDKQYTVLHPADVELAETSTDLLQKIKVLSHVWCSILLLSFAWLLGILCVTEGRS